MDPNNKKRPDISIHNPQTIGYENDLLLDISFVSPLIGIQNGNMVNLSINKAKKDFSRSSNIVINDVWVMINYFIYIYVIIFICY